MSAPRIALVVPDLVKGGGLPAVGEFLNRAIKADGRYRAEFVSVPMASRDAASLCVTRPASWLRGIQVQTGLHDGVRCRHVGAMVGELEFQRVAARAPLTRIFGEFDLIQIVGGSPCWALLAADVQVPVALQVATLTAAERHTQDDRSAVGRARTLMAEIVSRLDLRALRVPDLVFVENDWMANYVAAEIGPQRVVWAPPGVDTSLFRPAPSDKEPGDYILCVGRLADPRKNLQHLLHAYARLVQKMPDAPGLMLAGLSGPSDSDWALARGLGIAERISVRLGPSAAELADIYRNAKVFVLSSREEGLGIVLLEAMASGLAVVSTDCGGPATCVENGQTGYLVATDDVDAMADKMRLVLQDSQLRQRLGRHGRERAVQHFSAQRTGQRFIEGYDQMLRRGRTSGSRR